jgi:hypothetical protein
MGRHDWSNIGLIDLMIEEVPQGVNGSPLVSVDDDVCGARFVVVDSI